MEDHKEATSRQEDRRSLLDTLTGWGMMLGMIAWAGFMASLPIFGLIYLFG